MNVQWVFYPIHTLTTSTMKVMAMSNSKEDSVNITTEVPPQQQRIHLNIPPSFNADGKERMTFPGINFHRNFDLSPLLPFGMMLIICTIIFILIIFRRWPGLVAGIIAGCLTSISIYLLLLAIKDQRLVYE